ncbi:MAG: hypothetical protein IKR81_03095 [Victivallales bacterium]|nr:hypothetical protein [Victivallales bacterium]
MTPEQSLVQQIQQTLNAEQLERNPNLEDLALQFAELCIAANNRLANCADFISKGRRSEAVHEAHNLPDLLQLADLMEFEGIKKWRNLCSDMELAVAPALNAENLEKLRAAVNAEEGLAPLLKDYRRCVYQGDHRGCIVLLRKIIALDSENPSWKDNLRPLEEEALPELVQQAEKALASGNHVRLKTLFEELDAPHRVVKAPDELMARIKRELLSERAEDVKREAYDLLAKLRPAITASDGTLVEALLEKSTAIEQNDAFLDRPETWDSTLAEAREMLDLQSRRRAKQEDFLKAIDELQAMLARGGYTEMELRHEWERLLAWELPVSDMLRKQVEEIFADIRARKRRKVRIATIASVSVVIILLAVGGIVAFIKAKQLNTNSMVYQVEYLWGEEKYGELEAYLANLSQSNPDILHIPKVEDISRQLQEYKKTVAKHKEALNFAMDNLNTIRSSKYDGATVEEILQLLKDAELAAKQLSDDAALARIKAWRSGWEDWKERRGLQANSKIKEAVATISAALDEQKRSPFHDFEDEREKIQSLTTVANDARPYLVLGDEVERQRFVDVQERLSTWEREFDQRYKSFMSVSSELEKLRGAIPAAIMDLARYKSLMERYVEIAPDMDTLKKEYKEVLKDFACYEGAMLRASATLVTVPPTADMAMELKKQLDVKGEGIALKGSVWEADVQEALHFYSLHMDLKRKLNNLMNANPELFNLFYVKYRRKGEEDWRKLYSPRPLMSGADKEDATVKLYWGEVFFADSPQSKPIRVHTKDAFPDRLSSKDYDIEMHLRKEDNRCEYAKYLLRFISEGSESKNMPVYLLNGVQQLLDDNKIEPVLRALLIKRIMALLVDGLGDVIPEVVKMSRDFAQVPTDVPWMNPDHPDVKAAERKLKEVVKSTIRPADIIARLKLHCNLLESVLNCKVRCVGSCVQNKDGRLEFDLRGGNYSELWGCFVSAPGVAPHFSVVSKDGRTVLPGNADACHFAMPLFAPAPGYATSDILDALKLDGDTARGMRFPKAWPRNAN